MVWGRVWIGRYGNIPAECGRGRAILRALFADWDILFLDEPLKGLDEKIKKVTAEYIRSRVRGKTVLCVTHDPGDVDLLGASRVIEMK